METQSDDNLARRLAKQGDVEGLKKLLERGVSLRRKDGAGIRPIHLACERGHTQVVEFLVQSKADVNINKPDDDARTCLHWAAWKKHRETVQALLEMGAIKDAATRTGFTPLHYAAFSGSVETVSVLLRFGATHTLKDENQETPRQVAERFGHHEVAQLLADFIPDPATQSNGNSGGFIPLHGEPEASTNLDEDELVGAMDPNHEQEVENLRRIRDKAETVFRASGKRSPSSSVARNAMLVVAALALGVTIGIAISRGLSLR